ncbi:hypothetical protein OF83DRAFT_604883 [Amylostereum chailletii]|nr:hypothetical protein OF83DRAFT_604883 [Amylostereum chailletii]
MPGFLGRGGHREGERGGRAVLGQPGGKGGIHTGQREEGGYIAAAIYIGHRQYILHITPLPSLAALLPPSLFLLLLLRLRLLPLLPFTPFLFSFLAFSTASHSTTPDASLAGAFALAMIKGHDAREPGQMCNPPKWRFASDSARPTPPFRSLSHRIAIRSFPSPAPDPVLLHARIHPCRCSTNYLLTLYTHRLSLYHPDPKLTEAPPDFPSFFICPAAASCISPDASAPMHSPASRNPLLHIGPCFFLFIVANHPPAYTIHTYLHLPTRNTCMSTWLPDLDQRA